MLPILQKLNVLGNLSTRELSSVVKDILTQVDILENKIKELETNARQKVSKNKPKINKDS